MKKVKAVIEVFRVPVGWLNRLYVVFGTALILFAQYSWIPLMLYIVIWWGIYLLVLANVFDRGQAAAYRELDDDLPEDIAEMVAMHHNARMVALDDLADLCLKYGIPPEEAVPIIERGYGFRVVDDREGRM